jgi:hypothetical protein
MATRCWSRMSSADLFAGRYNIGYWAELPAFPDD